MGFFIRKSVNFGPLRFNFSKSGIGVSAGVKGARISTGPSGTYIHAGRNGFYYRQRLTQNPIPRTNNEQSSFTQPPALSNRFVIETADVSELSDTSITELLKQINERTGQLRLAPFAIGATVLSIICIWLLDSLIISAVATLTDPESAVSIGAFIGFSMSLAIAAVGAVLSWQIHKGDELGRTTPLFYELEPEAETKFLRIQSACEVLSTASRAWRVYSKQPTWDWKRNAGASALITRQPVRISKQHPPYIATNIEVWSMAFADLTMFFLPDYVFVRQRGKYGAVSYDSLQVSFAPTRFIEEEGVPPDTQVMDYTWRFVNKRGGPDRRFSNNRQIPIVQYGFVQLVSDAGLNIHLHISSLHAAATFADAFEKADSRRRTARQNERTENQYQSRPYIDPKIRVAYETLGVTVAASPDEIVSAYRNMAKMYHPDRLANLAPEFIELAEERMKDINAAYETLKRRQ